MIDGEPVNEIAAEMDQTLREAAPTVRRYAVYLCNLCIEGKGGECHVPGCALCWNRAPDLPMHVEAGGMCEPFEDAVDVSIDCGNPLDPCRECVRCLKAEVERAHDLIDQRTSLREIAKRLDDALGAINGFQFGHARTCLAVAQRIALDAVSAPTPGGARP